LIQVVSL